jgi:predicted RNA binding protein YcfA (HicA-like mRNA interferase family)
LQGIFGEPRVRGSHHIFKTPWEGDPRINIQKDGNMAKPYQVKAVIRAIKKLQEDS